MCSGSILHPPSSTKRSEDHHTETCQQCTVSWDSTKCCFSGLFLPDGLNPQIGLVSSVHGLLGQFFHILHRFHQGVVIHWRIRDLLIRPPMNWRFLDIRIHMVSYRIRGLSVTFRFMMLQSSMPSLILTPISCI